MDILLRIMAGTCFHTLAATDGLALPPAVVNEKMVQIIPHVIREEGLDVVCQEIISAIGRVCLFVPCRVRPSPRFSYYLQALAVQHLRGVD